MEDRKGGGERKDKEEEEKERSRRNREGRGGGRRGEEQGGRQSGWKRAQCWDPPTPTQLLAAGGGGGRGEGQSLSGQSKLPGRWDPRQGAPGSAKTQIWKQTACGLPGTQKPWMRPGQRQPRGPFPHKPAFWETPRPPRFCRNPGGEGEREAAVTACPPSASRRKLWGLRGPCPPLTLSLQLGTPHPSFLHCSCPCPWRKQKQKEPQRGTGRRKGDFFFWEFCPLPGKQEKGLLFSERETEA